MIDLRLGDALEVMATLPASSFDAIITDPPYHRVKAEAWDRQWKDDAAFLDWMGTLCSAWHRLLKPNGSLYVFASPRMAARIECKIGERFHVLNQIVWPKSDHGTTALRYGDERFRQYVQKSERIIFAEHFGADNHAKGEAGYEQKCDQLRGFVFEPIRAYLDGERRKAGVAFDQVRQMVGCAPGSGLPSHWFTRSQWMLPTAEKYELLRRGFNANGGKFLRREYEDLRREYEDLRREYEDLRREYEDLRRPFAVSAAVPYTDVWEFPTVSARSGKHPCEKPLALMEHIVAASTRPGALVLDCFAGRATTGVACRNLGRDCILIERDPEYHAIACRRLESCPAA